MASDTRNVKLGVCLVYFDGVDLGYTQGGVEVSVTTETHKVEVDQFGKTPINESIMGREVKVKVPMAETTLENMVKIMPGATLVLTGGAVATGTFIPTAASQPTTGQTVILNGVTVTAKTSPTAVAANHEYNIGANITATLLNLATMLNASTNPAIAMAQYSSNATTLTVTASDKGVAANAYTLVVGTYAGAVSGATLAGGTDPTSKRVDVTTGVGTDLLSVAKELRLHPKGKLAADKSEDFVVPLAMTAGAMNFTYKVDSERVFNVEFTGYPDPTSDRLFAVGDELAA